MENCLDLLVECIPRERSGSSTSNSYDYQKDWGIYLLLSSHSSVDDYLIFFDYHEDLIKFDSSTKPEHGSFFQVKTKGSGTWTVKNIIKKPKSADGNEKHSIICKLLTNKINFPELESEYYFVSNANYNVNLENGENSLSQNKICLHELASEEKLTIIESVKIDFPQVKIDQLQKMYLLKAEQPYDGHDKYIKGVLADFLEANSIETGSSIGLIYKSIFDEVKRKTNYRFRLKSIDEIAKKSISRSSFEGILQSFKQHKDFPKIFERVENQLVSERVPVGKIKKFRDTVKILKIKRMDRANNYLEVLDKLIDEYIKTNEISDNLIDCSSDFCSYLFARHPEYGLIPKEEIESFFMVKLYE